MSSPTLLLTLIALRYRLLWAAARTRAGRVALFVVGYLAALLVGGVLFLGGRGAAAAAISSGRSLTLYRAGCSLLFLFGLAASIVLGVGVNQAFADHRLRRFPLGRRARFAARHLAGILDPFWLSLLALYGGLAVGGRSATGVLPFTIGGALLLLATNYLAAATILGFVDRVMRTRRGSLVLLIAFALAVSVMPALAATAKAWGSSVAAGAAAAARLTPPFLAAEAFTSGGIRAGAAMFGLAGWTAALLVALAGVDGWQPRPGRSAAGVAKWGSLHDRLAELFGPQSAPLAGKLLRYAVRSPQARLAWITVLPSFALFVVGGRRESMLFAEGLAAFAFFGGNAAGPVALNLFGFDGGGFRRYLLFPVSPARILSAASRVALLPGAAFVISGLVLWTAIAPTHASWRALAMLAGSGLTGWLLYATLGLWTSVLAPTAIEFDRTWGNKLSLPANAVLVSSIVAFFLVLLLLMRLQATEPVLVAHWWTTVAAVPVVTTAYVGSLVGAGRVMGRRRERMLAAIDGV